MKKISAIGFALLMVFAVFVPVVSALNDPTKEGYQSVVNPNVLGERSPENIGHLDVLLACRAPQIGGEFTIVPVTVSAPFTNAARVDKAFVDQFVKQFGEPETKQYLPDGTFDGNFAPATYLLKQIDGNGGQPEFALVTIKAADSQTVVFLGHGITPADEPKEHVPVIVIKKATYGAEREVVVEEAYDETVTDVEAYDEVVPAVTHDEYKIVFYGQFTGYAKMVFGNSQHDFTYCGIKYQIVGNAQMHHPPHGSVKYLKTTIVDEPEYTIHHPAVTHVVHHDAVTETQGSFVNVKAKVQAVVDNGVTSFKFDNAQNPGGIFSIDNELLEQINDPAYGQVKTVKIKYTVDGGATKTINAQEYQTINLV